MKLPEKNTKVGRVLVALLSGSSYNRFEAEFMLHDHCLHSTISTLQNQYGICVSRKKEMVPGYLGSKTHCCRYWIDAEERERILSGSGKSIYLETEEQTHKENINSNNLAQALFIDEQSPLTGLVG